MKHLLATTAALALSATLSLAQTPPNPPTTTPTPAPAPAPKFNTGSPLDGIRNQAWSKLQEMTDAYEKCDPARFERALNELEQLRQQAKAAAFAATGAGEFSNVKPEEAQGLADAIRGMIEPRRFLLADLKRECGRGHRPGGIGTILGPRPDPPAQPTTPQHPSTQPPTTPQTPAEGTPVTPPQCRAELNPKPPPAATPEPPVESILDEIEEMERWEKDQKAKQRQQQAHAQTPPTQGLTQADLDAITRQQWSVDSFEADVAELKKLLKDGRIDEARELIDDLDDWLDWLEGRASPYGTMLKRPEIPQRLIDEWDRRIDDIFDEFLKLPPPGFRLDPTSSRILDMHNVTRAEYGLAPMHWDYKLACRAVSYGPTLAQYDRPVHSPRIGRETSRKICSRRYPAPPSTGCSMSGSWRSETSSRDSSRT